MSCPDTLDVGLAQKNRYSSKIEDIIPDGADRFLSNTAESFAPHLPVKPPTTYNLNYKTFLTPQLNLFKRWEAPWEKKYHSDDDMSFSEI